jgi:hypothetical protein
MRAPHHERCECLGPTTRCNTAGLTHLCGQTWCETVLPEPCGDTNGSASWRGVEPSEQYSRWGWKEATFGVELSLVNPADVASLRKAAERAHGVAIMGTSHKVSLLAMPLDRDPQWLVDCKFLKLIRGKFTTWRWNHIWII